MRSDKNFKGLQKSNAQVAFQYFSKEVDTSGNSLSIDIQSLLHKFESIIEEPNSLPPFRQRIHSILLIPKTTQHPSVSSPYFQKSKLKNNSKLLKKGFIRSSTSTIASPTLLVKKKDNTWRMCNDYRGLNRMTIPSKYPIPNIDELLDLHGATVFSKIHFYFSNHPIGVDLPDIHEIAFHIHSGQYEFTILPFGLTNALSMF